MLAGLLNNYCLVAHHLLLSPTPDNQFTYQDWSSIHHQRARAHQYTSKATQNSLPIEMLRILRMQALMNYSNKGLFIAHLASLFSEKVLLFTRNQQQTEQQYSYLPFQEQAQLRQPRQVQLRRNIAPILRSQPLGGH
jgi:hypothetical protein